MIIAKLHFFCEYSNMTVPHMAFNQRCGFAAYHTFMPFTEWHEGMDANILASCKGVGFGAMRAELENPTEIPQQMLTLLEGTA